MDEIDLSTKNGMMKLASVLLSFCIPCIAAAMAVASILFVVEVPLI